jgi:hypothetical protein
MRVTRRLLPTPEAAEYVGSASPAAFLAQWRRGLWPDPYLKRVKPMLWDRVVLDAWIGKPSVDTPVEPDLMDLI